MTLLAQSDIDKVLSDNPLLTAEGLDHNFFYGPKYIPPRVNLHEMQSAVDWLEKNSRRDSVNPEFTSYGLKHIAEKTTEGGYISNGAFIAAAYFLGFKVMHDRGTPNAAINISSKSVNRLRAEVGYG